MNIHSHQKLAQPQPMQTSFVDVNGVKLKKRPNTAIVMKKFYIPGERPKSSMLQHKLLEWKCECGEQIYVNKVLSIDLQSQMSIRGLQGKKTELSKNMMIKQMQGFDNKSQMKFKEKTLGNKKSPYDILIEKYSQLQDQDKLQQKMQLLHMHNLHQPSNHIYENQIPIQQQHQQQQQQQQQQYQFQKIYESDGQEIQEDENMDIQNRQEKRNTKQDNSIDMNSEQFDQFDDAQAFNNAAVKADILTYEQLLSQNRRENADSLIEENNPSKDNISNHILPSNENNPIQQQKENNFNSSQENAHPNQNALLSNSLNNISILSAVKNTIKQRPQTGNIARTVNIHLEKVQSPSSDGTNHFQSHYYNTQSNKNFFYRSSQPSAKEKSTQDRNSQNTCLPEEEDNNKVVYYARNLFQPSSQAIRNSSFYSQQQNRKKSLQSIDKTTLHGSVPLLTKLKSPLIQDLGKQVNIRSCKVPSNAILLQSQKRQQNLNRQIDDSHQSNINTQTDEGKNSRNSINLMASGQHTFKVRNLVTPVSSNKPSARTHFQN